MGSCDNAPRFKIGCPICRNPLPLEIISEETGEALSDKRRRYTIDTLPCPVCDPPKLSYGPITEEMVAEMLATAYDLGEGRIQGLGDLGTREEEPGYYAESRAVIRLLNVLPSSIADTRDARKYWRAKLQDLAKEG